jgi:superfamily II DNA or RNA helicase
MEKIKTCPDDVPRLIISTGRYIGEGFDDQRLDALLLAMPVSWRGTLQQYAGRLLRSSPGKSVVRIYDYVDHKVPVLMEMHRKRRTGYRSFGYRIDDPQ